jgi:Ca-activated chloride channel family protein
LKYIQPLRLLADMPSVEIPFCPGVRYIPGNPLIRANRGKGVADDTDQVPDASRISPVRMDKEHPDAAFIEIRGILDAKFVETASLMSPSHNIVSRGEGDNLTIRLSDQDEVPDRDFVLRWRERTPEFITSRAWVLEMGNESYALLEIRAPKATAGTASPLDFYFLVDRSGSMEGTKWQKAAEAVQSCVKALGEKDRAMVTLFGTHFNDFAEQPLPPRQLLADINFQKLDRLPLDGGTELGPALRHILEISALHSEHRQKTLILITDAQVGNEPAILKLMEATPDFPMHCFGIDNSLNDSLLLALARQQRGTFHSFNPADDVAKAVTDLAQTIRHPVLQDLRIPGGWETAEAGIPPLYSGQIHYLSARTATKNALEVTARNGDEQPASIPITSHTTCGDAPYLHWSKHRIQRYVSERRPAEAVALSVESNLICPLTAFIAWDESEKVAVASQALAQPSFAGDLMEANFVSRSPAAGRSATVVHFCSRLQDAGNVSRGTAPSSLLDPAAVVEQILRNQRVSGKLQAEPFTPEDRREAFSKLFPEICVVCFHPEWMSLWERILSWTFENKRDAISRSNLVAKLLFEMMHLAGELRILRSQLSGPIRELRKSASNQIKQLELLEKKMSREAINSGDTSALLENIKKTGGSASIGQIENSLSKIAQIENAVQEKLARFASVQK